MASEKSRVRRTQRRNERNLSFSRGRARLFRIANELSTQCEVEIAIILFSPSGKAYCFGHPSVDAVITRFRDSDPSFDKQGKTDNDTMSELDEECSDLTEEDEDERKRQEFRTDHPLAAPIDSPSLEELRSMKSALENLEKAVHRRKRELTEDAADSSSSTPDGACG